MSGFNHKALLARLSTPEKMAEARALQNKLRTAAGRVNQTPEERQLSRAQAAEKVALAQLQVDDRPQVKGQLAEAWAAQGKFLEASETHPDPERQKQYKAIHDAIYRDDSEGCMCEDTTARDHTQGRDVVVPAQNIQKMVFSPKHGKLMPLVVCRCGDMNVKPVPVHLQRRLDHIAEIQ